jgi:hypothetical protein
MMRCVTVLVAAVACISGTQAESNSCQPEDFCLQQDDLMQQYETLQHEIAEARAERARLTKELAECRGECTRNTPRSVTAESSPPPPPLATKPSPPPLPLDAKPSMAERAAAQRVRIAALQAADAQRTRIAAQQAAEHRQKMLDRATPTPTPVPTPTSEDGGVMWQRVDADDRVFALFEAAAEGRATGEAASFPVIGTQGVDLPRGAVADHTYMNKNVM